MQLRNEIWRLVPARLFDEDDLASLSSIAAEMVDVEYCFFEENTGTAKGHNLLAERAQTDYIMIMNPDVLLCPTFFLKMISSFEDPDVGMVEARQTPIEHPKDYDVETGVTSWASTAAAIVPRGVFGEVGGFDQKSFFMYCDDVDFLGGCGCSATR